MAATASKTETERDKETRLHLIAYLARRKAILQQGDQTMPTMAEVAFLSRSIAALAESRLC